MSGHSRPHILLVTSDQHRADSLGGEGHPCIWTPHLDKLALDGVRFSRAYSDCPVCIPQRTAWVTGIKSHVYGMPAYSEKYRIDRARDLFLGSLITQAGYQTHLVGKTHWHTDPSFRAGFEQVVSFDILARQISRETGRIGCNFSGLGNNEMNPGASLLPPHLYSSDWAVDRTLEFLENRDQTQPFFLWLSLTDPHPPNLIHEPYFSLYDRAEIPEPNVPAWLNSEQCPGSLRTHFKKHARPPLSPAELRKARGVYYGKITNLDHQLGRLIGALQYQELWSNTLVVYLSDHGEMLGDFGATSKSNFLDPAARIPLIVRPPDDWECARGSVYRGVVGGDDLLPTLCTAAGAAIPKDVTGVNLLPVCRDLHTPVHEFLHGQIEMQHMLHDGRWKYLYDAQDGGELLFDLETDPLERDPVKDVALIARYRARLVEHLTANGHEHAAQGKLLANVREPSPLAQPIALAGLSALGAGNNPI